MKRLPALEAEGAVFVDVRTPAEFAGGNRQGSVNIPSPLRCRLM